jgi:hypothetical protein
MEITQDCQRPVVTDRWIQGLSVFQVDFAAESKKKEAASNAFSTDTACFCFKWLPVRRGHKVCQCPVEFFGFFVEQHMTSVLKGNIY